MCLYSKQILPRRATKDIVCYKRMIEVTPTIYLTPYHQFRVYRENFNHVLHPKGKPTTLYHNGWHTVIRGGYFHAYTNYKYAIQMLYDGEIIMKCIIPKGALYWKSAADKSSMAHEFASDRMIFVEKICVQ